MVATQNISIKEFSILSIMFCDFFIKKGSSLKKRLQRNKNAPSYRRDVSDRYYTDLSMNTTYRENGKVISIKEPKTEQREIMSSVYSRQFVKRLPLG